MKKFKLLTSVIALLSALALIGCSSPTGGGASSAGGDTSVTVPNGQYKVTKWVQDGQDFPSSEIWDIKDGKVTIVGTEYTINKNGTISSSIQNQSGKWKLEGEKLFVEITTTIPQGSSTSKYELTKAQTEKEMEDIFGNFEWETQLTTGTKKTIKITDAKNNKISIDDTEGTYTVKNGVIKAPIKTEIITTTCLIKDVKLVDGKLEAQMDISGTEAAFAKYTFTKVENQKPGEGGETKPGEGGETKPGEGGETKPGEGGETKPGEGGETINLANTSWSNETTLKIPEMPKPLPITITITIDNTAKAGNITVDTPIEEAKPKLPKPIPFTIDGTNVKINLPDNTTGNLKTVIVATIGEITNNSLIVNMLLDPVTGNKLDTPNPMKFTKVANTKPDEGGTSPEDNNLIGYWACKKENNKDFIIKFESNNKGIMTSPSDRDNYTLPFDLKNREFSQYGQPPFGKIIAIIFDSIKVEVYGKQYTLTRYTPTLPPQAANEALKNTNWKGEINFPAKGQSPAFTARFEIKVNSDGINAQMTSVNTLYPDEITKANITLNANEIWGENTPGKFEQVGTIKIIDNGKMTAELLLPQPTEVVMTQFI